MSQVWSGLAASVVLCSLCSVLVSPSLSAEPIGDWTLVPDYRLGGQAANHPGPRLPHPTSQHSMLEMEAASILFRGHKPSERLINLLPPSQIPVDEFTYELWINQHVNQPVAVLFSVRGREPGSSIPLTIGFEDWESFLVLRGREGEEVQLRSKLKKYGGYKQRWVHVVAAYDGHTPKLYVNGEDVAQGHLHHDSIAWPENAELELAAYMHNEPFMQIGNLVHSARIYDEALPPSEVRIRYEDLCNLVENGLLYPNLFHFTAGPYLNHVTQTSMSLCWETDRDATAKIRWGTSSELAESATIDSMARRHEYEIANLQPETPYFYQIESTSTDGKTIDSGVLTFKTAVPEATSFRFAVVGDTEARPHINDRLAKQIWQERPNFIINLGDLTDAGETPHRYEWTHEYFVGMTQLASRVPVLAVPGNGESDLHWFRHYHNYPGQENYYRFTFGDATFFMLDSNRRREQFKPGGEQYEWLEEQLKSCHSKWKFVCHHHATYTGEENDYGDAWNSNSQFGDPLVRAIVPLYEKYNVDIAMFGHLHLYERSHPIREGKVDHGSGTVHLLAGGGGGNLEDFAPTPAFFSAQTYRGHHFVTFEVSGDELSMRMHATDGTIRDWFTLDKSDQAHQLKVSRPAER
ncbi:MAG: metallophosphoesterase [Planctomycetales bacterium]|nr:metallophosphoesterase [Planctomycetales bacterium]